MNIGDWRIRQDEKGNCVFLHKHPETKEFKIVKKIKPPYFYRKKVKEINKKKNNLNYDNDNKKKKCSIQ